MKHVFGSAVFPDIDQGACNPAATTLSHTFRFADWDSDGDMDVLLTANRSLWLYERLPGDAFEKHHLLNLSNKFLPGFDLPGFDLPHAPFEVADWDGDWQLFDCHCFLSFVTCAGFVFPHMYFQKGMASPCCSEFPSKLRR